MAKKVLSTRAQVAQVAARQKFLEDAVKFVFDVLKEKGKVLFHCVHNSHTESQIELVGFNDFSFWTHGAKTMYGGEELKVWYHPATDGLRNAQTLVLHMSWQDISKCSVRHFRSEPKWQRQLRVLMRDKKEAIAKHEKKLARDMDKAARLIARERQSSAIAQSLEENRRRLALA